MSLPAERLPSGGEQSPALPAGVGELEVEAVWHPGMDLDTFDRLVLLLCSPAPRPADRTEGDDDGGER